MIVFKTQNNFGRGQINPRLQSRVKDPIYENGVKEATNCFIEPSGILKKRYGTQYIDDLSFFGTTFKLIPFEYSTDINYLLVFYPGFVYIYQNSSFVIGLPTVYADANSITNLRYVQSVDKMVLCDGINIPQQLILAVPLLTWSISPITFPNVPTYDFNKNYYSFTFTVSAAYGSVIVTSSAPAFSADLVGGLFIGNGGIARITAYTDTTHIIVQTLDSTYFFTDDKLPSGTPAHISGLNAVIKQPVWSDTKGWPDNPCLHNNRLWFGGTKLRPQNLWGSVIGDYYNFDEGSGLPDDCINVNIDSQQLNSIEYLISANTLQIFTNTGVYVLSTSNDGIVALTLECKEGAADVPPIFIDSQVLYAQRGGKIIRNFLFNFEIRAYDNSNVSVFASDIINNPVDSTVLKYNDNESTNYVFFINSDGTLSTYQTQRIDNISAWTSITTAASGQFINCVAVGNTLYFIIQRTINNETKYYLEEMDETVYLDSYLTYHDDLSTQTVTGLETLEGQTVTVIRDGYIENQKVVMDGEITSDYPGNNFTVGLPIVSTIVPLPLAGDYSIGETTYLVKTIRTMFIDMYQSFGIKINGTLIPYFYLDNYILNSIYPGFTGIAQYPYLKDWELRQNIQITHDYPTPFTLCGIGYEVVMSIPH